MTPVANNVGRAGSLAPKITPSAVFTPPATNPLIKATCTGSPTETLRVRLLSTAHARHAPAMASGPHGMPIAGRPPHESTMPPVAMSATPSAMRESKFSLKRNHASNAVSTPSRFSNNDALDAGVADNPTINNTGPMKPPAMIAPASHGASRRVSDASLEPAPLSRERQSQKAPNPMPEPR